MSLVQALVVGGAGGGNAAGWIPGGAGGFGLAAPFTIPPFSTRTTPNIALVAGWRSFGVSLQADDGAGGGTHVWLRVHDPGSPNTVLSQYEIAEFITEDGYQMTTFGARADRLNDGQLTRLVSLLFDNGSLTLTSTVSKFDGMLCYAA